MLIGGPDSNDTVGARHFELEVGVIGDRHEPGVAGASENARGMFHGILPLQK
jgi:hypothetical protein